MHTALATDKCVFVSGIQDKKSCNEMSWISYKFYLLMSTFNLAFVQQNMTIEMTQQKCIVTNSNDKEIKRH